MVSRTEILPRLVQRYLKSGLRGSTRCTFALARRLKTLQAVPVTINGRQRLWVDLRDGLSHALLAGSPWAGVPWEVDEQLVMRQLVRPGDVVFDIGAHIGLHTVLLSELTGPSGVVHAFEPNAAKADALAITVSSLRNATLQPFALGDAPGEASLFVPEDQSMASLADWTNGRVGGVRVTRCDVHRLDDLIECGEIAPPDFVKCDVEGSEARLFSGARVTLNRERAPVILYEANALSARAFGSIVSAATDLLRSFRSADYHIFHVQPGGRLQVLEAFDPDCEHYNLVALPASRLDRLSSAQNVTEC